ncbi:FIG00653360: hypothetical protein [hydrothermal vent metagenome]|uniref:Alpha/beta hydrolase n=1 Tax=hydrothermal vent metagenome TaxID=652676 RepID=A0A3B0T0X6_9ZZZZ
MTILARFLMIAYTMKKYVVLLFLSFALYGTAQQLTLKKGTIIDAVPVHDSISESFALYLPTGFEVSKKWPVVFVYDMQGRGKQALSMFRGAAEEQGYILAASNNVQDSLTLSKNILISSRMYNRVFSILPIEKNRSYTAGFSGGARLASLIPTFIKEVRGVISCGSPIANEEILSSKNRFHFIGIAGNADYNYTSMLSSQKILNKLKYPNQLLVFEGGHEWPRTEHIGKAMEIFTLASMAKGEVPKEDSFVNDTYRKNLGSVSALIATNKPLLANKLLGEVIDMYRAHKNVDSLKASVKTLKRSKLYKINNRNRNAVLFKESLIREDYAYYLEEDVLTYNFNNLGWWNYQMEELKKFNKSTNVFEQRMGKRLKGYINALIADNIDLINVQHVIDGEALNFLWMLKTITEPKDFDPYLKVISYSAQTEDYGTALFYLEELLKNGYTNKAELYALEQTALLRITPEFNQLVEKYLKDARYEVIEE